MVNAQIGHARPVADAYSNQATALAPVRFFNPVGMQFAKNATSEDIGDVSATHTDAARLAIDAGFDAVKIHFGPSLFSECIMSR